MTEDIFESVMHDLKEAVTDPKTPANVRKAVLLGVKRLKDFLQEEEEEQEQEEHEHEGSGEPCPDCGSTHGQDHRIVQIIPTEGWLAVFAETDSHDPQAMAVETIAFFALIEYQDGYSCVTGMFAYGDEIMPCFPIRTFVGYVPPGKDPNMHAEKVREKIIEIQRDKANEGASEEQE